MRSLATRKVTLGDHWLKNFPFDAVLWLDWLQFPGYSLSLAFCRVKSETGLFWPSVESIQIRLERHDISSRLDLFQEIFVSWANIAMLLSSTTSGISKVRLMGGPPLAPAVNESGHNLYLQETFHCERLFLFYVHLNYYILDFCLCRIYSIKFRHRWLQSRLVKRTPEFH